MALEDFPELANLTIAKKLALMEDLWDSIIVDDSVIPIPESHKKELDRRNATLDSVHLLSLEELKDRVEKRK